MQEKIQKIKEVVDAHAGTIQNIKKEMAKIIVGQEKLVERLLVAIFSNGHILLESVPGLAKTTAITTLARIFHVEFNRIQFTPDLLPSDLIGSRIFNPQDNSFFIKKGPIFANFVLADEINRSPAKVQSALLEAMQEKQVTIGEESFSIPAPFFVMATQNPIEQEGTYTLPEAQVDRFLLKAVIDYPSKKEEVEIINRAEEKTIAEIDFNLSAKDILDLQNVSREIYMDASIKNYIADIVHASRYPEKIEGDIKADLFSYGASPRASIALMQAAKAIAFIFGRPYVIPEDVKEIALDVLRHRIVPSYEAEALNISSDDLVRMILDNVQVP